MFTGLVSHKTEVVRAADGPTGLTLTLGTPWDDLVEGESIAVNGICLTVTGHTKVFFQATAMTTTVQKTTLGSWVPGRHVNLERALRAGDRLGGHIVQGHIDGVASVSAAHVQGDALLADIHLWEGVEGLCVPQGSITIDGVSLTIAAMPAPRTVTVSIIEYTRTHTTLGDLKLGNRVNVELDVIGKYVKQQMAAWTPGVTPPVR